MKLLAFITLACCILAINAINIKYWAQQAMELQRQNQMDLPLDQVSWGFSMRAHDYYRGRLYNPPAANILHRPLPDKLHHSVPIADQLDNGFRWLDFEVRWIPEIFERTSRDADNLYVCATDRSVYQKCFMTGTNEERSFCNLNGIVNYGFDSGCFADYDRNFQSNVQEVMAWVNQVGNEDQFVIFDIKWKLVSSLDNEPAALKLMEKAINAYAGNKTFTPRDLGNSSWPSMRTLTDNGKQILFICDSPACANSTLVFSPSQQEKFVAFEKQMIKGFEPSNCSNSLVGPERQPFDDFVKFWEDSTYNILINGNKSTFTPESGLLDITKAQQAMFCGFSVGVTDVTASRAQYAVWSWAKDMPARPVTSPRTLECVRVHPFTYFWDSVGCEDTIHGWACQNTSNPFHWFTNNTANYGNTDPDCPAGFEWSYPKNPREMEALARTMDADSASQFGVDKYVWINVPAIPQVFPSPPRPVSFSDFNLSPYVTHPDNNASLKLAVAPINDTAPQGHRFCGLRPDAMVYDCHWSEYVVDILLRQIPFLVIIGVAFLIFVAAVIVNIVLIKKLDKMQDKRDGNESSDEESANSDSEKSAKEMKEEKEGNQPSKFKALFIRFMPVLFVLPVVLLIVGAVLALLHNMDLVAPFNSVRTNVNNRRDAALAIMNGILKAFFAVPMTAQIFDAENQKWLSGKMLFAIDDTMITINDFNKGLQFSSISREYSGYILLGLIVVSSLFAFWASWKKSYRGLAACAVIMALLLFINADYIAFNNGLKISQDDACTEITRVNGAFKLWQRAANVAFYNMNWQVSEPAIRNLTIQGCTQLNDLGKLPYQVASNFVCHASNIHTDVAAVRLVDNGGRMKAISMCANTSALGCVNDDLKQRSQRLMGVIDSINSYRTINANVTKYMDIFSSATAETSLKGLLCKQLDKNVEGLFIGLGITAGGQLIYIVLAFWMAYYQQKTKRSAPK